MFIFMLKLIVCFHSSSKLQMEIYVIVYQISNHLSYSSISIHRFVIQQFINERAFFFSSANVLNFHEIQ